MKAYGITDSGPNGMYDMQDPTWLELRKVRVHVRDRIKLNVDRSFLIFYIFACHGIQIDGKQAVVVNGFDKRAEFYNLYVAETELRQWASKYSNSFHMCIFACCREIHNKSRHSGCVSGPIEVAREHFNKKMEQ